MNDPLKRFVDDNRRAFDSLQPDPVVLQQIHNRLEKDTQKKGVFISMRTFRWAAAACILLMAGLSVPLWQNSRSVHNITPAGQVASAAPAPQPSLLPESNDHLVSKVTPQETPVKEISSPHSVYASLEATKKRNLFVALANMESPGSRLQAAMDAYDIKSMDHDIVNVLVKTLNHDPNTNVRLAAFEALSHFHREKYVKDQLIRSLQKQQDPVIQIAIIELLTRIKQQNIEQQLEKITSDPNTIEAVKNRAYVLLLKQKS